jgi:hypothetical protein
VGHADSDGRRGAGLLRSRLIKEEFSMTLMTRLPATKRLGLVALFSATTAVFLVPAAHAKKSCVLAGGEATMITRDLAEFMAKAALNNSIKAKGLTAEGAAKLSCKDPAPLTYCLAEQKACK